MLHEGGVRAFISFMNPEQLRIDPTQLASPKTRGERLKTLFVPVSQELVERVRSIQLDFASMGESEQTALDALGRYIASEVAYYAKHHPPGYRYNSWITASLKRTREMDQLYAHKEYKKLMKICLDISIEYWERADRADETHNSRSAQEVEQLRKAAAENDEHNAAEAEKARTIPGYRPEYGFPPEMLRSGGDHNRRVSLTFLMYAVALARSI